MSTTTVQVKRITETVRDFPDLGKKIKQARENDKRSLSEICRQSNISRSYWYQLENEDLRSPVTENLVRKVEKALNINLGVSFDD
ncbi:helix-turn-helix domain-containing protein [Crocosphaera sp. Alani8]|uniref:helix-turn-helix domain-containing protein n=1 Tax=Crocosphaera sp. Alani8 TaxID=3038952 RepID=UPI00313C1150